MNIHQVVNNSGPDGLWIRYYSLHFVNSRPSYMSVMVRSFLPTLQYHPLRIFGIVELAGSLFLSQGNSNGLQSSNLHPYFF